MAGNLQRYATDRIAVIFDPGVCIHAAECLRGLSTVFDARARPWIRPEAAAPGAIADVVQRCPSGALQYRRLDGGADEHGDNAVTVTPAPDGPLFVRGRVTLRRPDGAALREDTRMALCRCGHSKNKPFCDNSHFAVAFEAD